MPNVRLLDFQKVRLKEKVYAKNLFESEKGKKIIEDMINKKFSEEEEAEYIQASDNIQKDFEKQKAIYVLIINIEINSIGRKLRRSKTY